MKGRIRKECKEVDCIIFFQEYKISNVYNLIKILCNILFGFEIVSLHKLDAWFLFIVFNIIIFRRGKKLWRLILNTTDKFL